MKTYDVYHPWNLELTKASGSIIQDSFKEEYIDLYGGHGVISIGHNHPAWTVALNDTFKTISYYSNVVRITEQEEVNELLNELAGTKDYRLFMCNSGAEANENALKVASFTTGRAKILAFKGAFHGRSVGAVSITDNPKIQAPYGSPLIQTFFDFSDLQGVKAALESKEYAAVIIEGIQGVAGVFEAKAEMWKLLETVTKSTGTLFIVDEIQSGCGRTGTYFAFQHWNIQADIITMAKGIGNGFPVGAVLIQPGIEPVKGQLGTTFGGNYMACAAMKTVLNELKSENLIATAQELGKSLVASLQEMEDVKEVRGRGLMIGIKTDVLASELQKELLEKGFVVGTSTCANTIRILPPLTIPMNLIEAFVQQLKETLTELVPSKIIAS